MNSPKKGDLVY